MSIFMKKNTVGWTADNMQEHVFDCHEEIVRLTKAEDLLGKLLEKQNFVKQKLRREVALLIREKQLWTWIHEEMGCFLQHSTTLYDTCKWVVLDVDHNVVAEGSDPIEAMKDAERTYTNNLEGEMNT